MCLYLLKLLIFLILGLMINFKYRCKCNMQFNTQCDLNSHYVVCILNLNVHKNSINLNPAAAAYQVYAHISKPKQIYCRYDSNSITDANRGLSHNVCSNKHCELEYLGKCKILFDCGHECLGLKTDECNKFKCLNRNCNNYNNIYSQDEESMCSICLTDSFKIFNLIQLPCKHYVHRKCFLLRLRIKWGILSDELNFNFLKCPCCNVRIEKLENFTNDLEVIRLYKESLEILDKVNTLISFIQNDVRSNIEKYSFYLCEKCGNPFFFGLKMCGDFEDIDGKNISENSAKKFCLDCLDYSKIKGFTNCDKHGREHIQYKCKFCCELASHVCFGTTHFCEDCHIKQMKGDYLTQKNKSEFPICDGEETCNLQINHPPNGEEFALFCLLSTYNILLLIK